MDADTDERRIVRRVRGIVAVQLPVEVLTPAPARQQRVTIGANCLGHIGLVALTFRRHGPIAHQRGRLRQECGGAFGRGNILTVACRRGWLGTSGGIDALIGRRLGRVGCGWGRLGGGSGSGRGGWLPSLVFWRLRRGLRRGHRSFGHRDDRRILGRIVIGQELRDGIRPAADHRDQQQRRQQVAQQLVAPLAAWLDRRHRAGLAIVGLVGRIGARLAIPLAAALPLRGAIDIGGAWWRGWLDGR